MPTYDIRVSDKSPKNIVRQMLLRGIGPRDPAGRDANLTDWDFGGNGQTFKSYCKQRDWTLAQVLSMLEWQCCYIFGGLDEVAFTQEWYTFRPIVRDQRLMDRDWTAQVDGRPETNVADLNSLEV